MNSDEFNAAMAKGVVQCHDKILEECGFFAPPSGLLSQALTMDHMLEAVHKLDMVDPPIMATCPRCGHFSHWWVREVRRLLTDTGLECRADGCNKMLTEFTRISPEQWAKIAVLTQPELKTALLRWGADHPIEPLRLQDPPPRGDAV